MRAIIKGPEPHSLTAHRQTDHSNYDNYADRPALRHSLVTEQRGICCYCMERIYNGLDTMKIEHWRSQIHYPAEQLNYQNLLAACRGGEGNPPKLQHCDTRKGDNDLLWNPADPAHRIETRVRYEADGSIRSDNAEFDAQLNNVVNLNLPVLRNNRKSVLDAILEWWKSQRQRLRGPVPRARIQQERDKYLGGHGDLAPYCQVVVWWLQQKLAAMPA